MKIKKPSKKRKLSEQAIVKKAMDDAASGKGSKYSSPLFARIAPDKVTGLTVLLHISPDSRLDIHKSPASVIKSTMVGDCLFIERVSFQSFKKASEYIKEASYSSITTFCKEAIDYDIKITLEKKERANQNQMSVSSKTDTTKITG